MQSLDQPCEICCSRTASTLAFSRQPPRSQRRAKHLPGIVTRRGGDADLVLSALALLEEIVVPIESDSYLDFEATARARIERRDPDDWPVLAAALALDCAIWTEDKDFFGAGVATWTTDRIELFLSGSSTE